MFGAMIQKGAHHMVHPIDERPSPAGGHSLTFGIIFIILIMLVKFQKPNEQVY